VLVSKSRWIAFGPRKCVRGKAARPLLHPIFTMRHTCNQYILKSVKVGGGVRTLNTCIAAATVTSGRESVGLRKGLRGHPKRSPSKE
jgi:hypothetical protein